MSKADVDSALREIRIALLEADVALSVVKEFIVLVREKALGQEVTRSVTPGQMVIKIVNDHLVEILGVGASELNLATTPPAVIMLVGLQGSGKTTTTAKLAKHLRSQYRKNAIMTSLDIRRPAAQQQLKSLGETHSIPTLPIVPFETPEMITERALDTGKKEGHDVILLDTAGRLHIDDSMMSEALKIQDLSNPCEILFVADSMTGQDAVNAARAFSERLNITGIILTRIDGDARGGAALSIREVTGTPIKLMGTGEKIDDIEVFHPDRIASRILGMGDVVSLVEKAQETVREEEAEEFARKLQKGQFDLEDMAKQLGQMRKMGGVGGILNKLPSVGKIKNQLQDANIDDNVISRQEAIIFSMTTAERKNPKLFNGSRRRRIAEGSGTTVQEVNRLLKQHKEMAKAMKKMSKLGRKGFTKGMPQGMPPGILPRI